MGELSSLVVQDFVHQQYFTWLQFFFEKCQRNVGERFPWKLLLIPSPSSHTYLVRIRCERQGLSLGVPNTSSFGCIWEGFERSYPYHPWDKRHIYLHERLIFMVFMLGKYTIIPWMGYGIGIISLTQDFPQKLCTANKIFLRFVSSKKRRQGTTCIYDMRSSSFSEPWLWMVWCWICWYHLTSCTSSTTTSNEGFLFHRLFN